jgi:Raf kinase inhibitor-like YbhB/YbcL family protein
MPLSLRTAAFADGKRIPTRHTRDGENLSPPLAWSGVPEGTRSFALIVEDPDAPNGTFYHWAVANIPPDRTGLPEGAGGKSEGTMRFGRNDFGNVKYDGPEPPRGHGTHHYHFRLAALDVPALAVSERTGVADLWREATRHALATAETVGTYDR